MEIANKNIGNIVIAKKFIDGEYKEVEGVLHEIYFNEIIDKWCVIIKGQTGNDITCTLLSNVIGYMGL